jgi:hypothetical protein
VDSDSQCGPEETPSKQDQPQEPEPERKRNPELRDREEALAAILSPLRRRQATRHVWLGEPGQGKTTANRELIEMGLEEGLLDLVLTHDEKDPYDQQYPGTARVDPDDLARIPPRDNEDKRRIVFRGFAITLRHDQGCNPDSIARMAWEIVLQSRASIALNLDELTDCFIPNSQLWSGDYIGKAYRKGRSVGITVFATLQQPQMMPREVWMAESMGIFRVSQHDAGYLASKRVITKEQIPIVTSLSVGEFLLLHKSERSVNGELFS